MLNRYSFISIISHAVLLLTMLLGLKLSQENIVIGDEKIQWMDSYIYKDETHENVKMNKTVNHELDKTKNKADISTKKIIKVERKPLQKSLASSQSNGTQTNELLATLHAAIQQQQHYPESAMNMERQGRATVIFTLSTNGSIRNLRLLKSSGTESLDNAALAAVRDAVPFHAIDKYLNHEKEFSIDVVFELT